MPHDAMPGADDLILFLMGSNCVDDPISEKQAMLDYVQAMASAVTRWGNDTGYSPWLAQEEQTLTMDPPSPDSPDSRDRISYNLSGLVGGSRIIGGGDTLYVRNGILSVDSLLVRKTATFAGTELTEGTDFWLAPADAPVVKKPFTRIVFRECLFGEPQSIVIEATVGFSATVPDDVWNAVIDAGAIQIIPALERLKTRAVVSREEGDVKTVYMTGSGKGPFSATLEECRTRYKETVCRSPYKPRFMQ